MAVVAYEGYFEVGLRFCLRMLWAVLRRRRSRRGWDGKILGELMVEGNFLSGSGGNEFTESACDDSKEMKHVKDQNRGEDLLLESNIIN